MLPKFEQPSEPGNTASRRASEAIGMTFTREEERKFPFGKETTSTKRI